MHKPSTKDHPPIAMQPPCASAARERLYVWAHAPAPSAFSLQPSTFDPAPSISSRTIAIMTMIQEDEIDQQPRSHHDDTVSSSTHPGLAVNHSPCTQLDTKMQGIRLLGFVPDNQHDDSVISLRKKQGLQTDRRNPTPCPMSGVRRGFFAKCCLTAEASLLA